MASSAIGFALSVVVEGDAVVCAFALDPKCKIAAIAATAIIDRISRDGCFAGPIAFSQFLKVDTSAGTIGKAIIAERCQVRT
jgi:hypothetical protein